MRDGKRGKFRKRFALISLAIVAVVTAIAYAFAPPWLPSFFAGDDEGYLAFERTHRRFRAIWGMPQPAQPDLARLPQRLAEHGLTQGAPVLIRIFKREFQFELWMLRDGRFHRFATYPVCRWSGQLGPKIAEGDRQTPEGFYTVDRTALNPNSQWYRSFNLGFPNAFDRAHGRTGSFLMVHGGCASIGCFAMTNAQMDEIWRLITAALSNGQKRFQVQVYPFRMSDEKLAKYADHPAVDFWRMLKAGNDVFEETLLPPRVNVCDKTYRFEATETADEGASTITTACAPAASRN